jgi:branched-subunit amino acid aminotransferase/4-amino-4-deoxychorismate lyase
MSGGALLTHEHRREIPTAKTTNYLTMLKHRPRVQDAGAVDLLYHDGQRVFEAASASVYFVFDRVISAPDKDVLWGTVGSLLLELVQGTHETRLQPISLEDALNADEVFLTSTTRGVLPIVRIDERTIGTGKPGPVTRELVERYRDLVEGKAQISANGTGRQT